MQDKLLISVKVKKTIDYIEKITNNYPHTEVILKNKIIDSCYDLLRLTYKASIYKEINTMKDVLVNIKMIEYYINKSLNKKIINFKKYENIGNYLLEINKMVNKWILNEKEKQSL